MTKEQRARFALFQKRIAHSLTKNQRFAKKKKIHERIPNPAELYCSKTSHFIISPEKIIYLFCFCVHKSIQYTTAQWRPAFYSIYHLLYSTVCCNPYLTFTSTVKGAVAWEWRPKMFFMIAISLKPQKGLICWPLSAKPKACFEYLSDSAVCWFTPQCLNLRCPIGSKENCSTI